MVKNYSLLIVMMAAPIAAFGVVVVDEFSDGNIDSSLWGSQTTVGGSSSQFIETQERLEFVSELPQVSTENSSILRLTSALNWSNDFALILEMGSDLSSSSPSGGRIGLSIEVTSGISSSSRGILQIGMETNNSAGFYIDRLDPLTQTRESLAGTFYEVRPSSLTLHMGFEDATQEFWFFTHSPGGGVVNHGTLGVGDIAGSLGQMDWDLTEVDGLTLSLFGTAEYAPIESGSLFFERIELESGDFTVAPVPEPKMISFIIALSAATFAFRRRRRPVE